MGRYELGSNAHGFVRDSGGTITTFDPPFSQRTFPSGMNDARAITGSYGLDSGDVLHAFVRDPSGVMATFDPVGSTSTFSSAINSAGT